MTSRIIRPIRPSGPSRPFLAAGAVLLAALVLGGCAADEEPAGDAADTPTATESTPAALTDDEAVRAFYDAVVTGDRAAATEVATDAAVAFFDPYEPRPEYTLAGPDDGYFFISPGAAPFQCTVADGMVQDCMDEPTGDTGLSDEEAATAFFDAVVAGDRDAAEAVATEEAAAYLAPYEPRPDWTMSDVEDGLFFISPGAAPFQCTVADGLVRECVDETLAPEQRE